MSSIMKFQAQMKGFMRPNKFTVQIGATKAGSRKRFAISCFQCQIPGNVIATTDKDVGFRSVAYQTIYSDIILGFYADDKLRELKFWQDWIESIHNRKTNRWAYYDDYKSEVTITPINRSGDDVATWTLHDAYPKQIDPIQLDYGTNDAVMTINVTMTYRHFTVTKWNLVNQDETLDNIYENSSNILEDKIEDWEINKYKYNKIAVERFYKFLDNKDKDIIKNNIKDEIKLILYNNRLED